MSIHAWCRATLLVALSSGTSGCALFVKSDPVVIGYYETLRWTEKPESYLRRALGRALFQGRGVRQIISRPGPTLDVDLDAFEELKVFRHAARIQVTWVLHDDQRVQLQRTLTIERVIPPGDPGDPSGAGAIAPAMAEVFEEAVQRVVAGVMEALPRSASATASSNTLAPSAL